MTNVPFRAWCRRVAGVILVFVLLFVASPIVARAATYAKVKVSVAKMYKSTKKKKTFIRLKKGTVVTVKGVSGKWAKVKKGGNIGYILVKNLVKVTKKAAI